MTLKATHPMLPDQVAYGFRVGDNGAIEALTKLEVAALIARASQAMWAFRLHHKNV